MNELVEFFTDPLRLTLLVAGVVVVLGILIFGRRSAKSEANLYHGHSHRDFKINNPPPDLLVDEEVIVLPPRKKESSSPDLSTEEFELRQTKPEVQEFNSENHGVENLVEQENEAPEPIAESTPESFEHKRPASNIPDEVQASHRGLSQAEADQSKAAASSQEAEPAPASETSSKPQPKPERFIVFHIMPASNETFTGKEIHQVVSSLGLAFGKHGVYHFPADSAREGNSQFCLVNMTAEGNFDKETLPTMETRGVSLILRLTEDTKDGLALFSNMLAIAQGMSRRLGANILDQTRVPLTPDIVTNLRSDIAKFQTQLNKRIPATEV